MAATDKLVTAEQLWRMPETLDGYRYELLEGKLIKMPLGGGMHGACCAAVGSFLSRYLKQRAAGHGACNCTGVFTEKDPNTVLGPDLAFWSRERLPEIPEGFVEVAPDLAVEVIDPKTRTVTVYRSRQDVCVLGDADEITGGDVLPGFSCRVGEFFE